MFRDKQEALQELKEQLQTEEQETETAFPSRYVHNPGLYQEELAQFQDQFCRKRAARGIRKLLWTLLFLILANLCAAAWFYLRYKGILS